MTTKVNFKINPETLELDVSIENDITSIEGEINIAKRILSMSTQLNFIEFPYSRSIDLGASIVIKKEFYEDDDDDDNYNGEEDFEISSFKEEILDEEILEEEDLSLKNEDETTESLSWKDTYDLDTYIITLNHDEAKKIVGGLTTPSCIATILIYEMLKRTINKVELCL